MLKLIFNLVLILVLTCITVHAENTVVYYNNFDDDPIGTYTQILLAVDWNGAAVENGIAEGRVSVIEGKDAFRGKSLRVFYPAGTFGPQNGGAQWRMTLPKKYEELYCSYAIRFGEGFNFVQGGKIPGLTGGDGNTGGKIPDGRDGWSARMMWRAGGRAVQYVYHPDQMDMWGQDFNWLIGGERRFKPGIWHRVEHRIVMNTPGKRNGIIQAWFDGQLALNQRNLCFRDVPHLVIDAFYFSTFFGGGDSSWSAVKDERIDFDEVIISTAPINH